MPRDASESHSTFLLTKQWPPRNFLGLLTVADTDHPSFKITVQWVHGMSSQSAWLTNNVHVSTNLQGALQITVILDCKFRSDVRVCVTLEPKYTSLYPGNRISCFHEQTSNCFKVSAISHVNWHPLVHALFSHWGSDDFWWDPISSCSVNSHRSAEYRQKIQICSLIWVVWFWKAIGNYYHDVIISIHYFSTVDPINAFWTSAICNKSVS